MSSPELITLCTADGASATIHYRGAHLSHWQPAGAAQNRLFVSERAIYAEGTPIRGGVPVIFPQFAGEGPLPKHGFARTAQWQLQHHTADRALLTLTDDASSHALWPHAFQATLAIALGSTALEVSLGIENTGRSAFSFTAALHTYLSVQDLASTQLLGLHGLRYCDTADQRQHKTERTQSLSIAGEVDRNYFDTPATLTLQEPHRKLHITQAGFADTVVWNPGEQASRSFKDLAPDDFRRFICVEAAAIQHPIQLAAGQQWRGSQTLCCG